MVKESIRKRQSTSCNLCRTIKRKCDGGFPCSNCSKRNHVCTYANIDHRKHRYSSEYINQLEVVNRQAQDCLNDLIRIRNDPEQLIRRVEKLSETLASSSSVPANIHLPPIPSHPNLPPPPGVLIPSGSSSSSGGGINGRRINNDGLDLTSKYFRGPDGRNGYFLGATTIYDESMVLGSNSYRPSIPIKIKKEEELGEEHECRRVVSSNGLVDLKVLTSKKVSELIDVALMYFDHQILCYILNAVRTRQLYDELVVNSQDPNHIDKIFCCYPNNNYISPELIYSLACIGSMYRDEPQDAVYYYELSQRIILNDNILNKSSYPKLIAILLNAIFELSRGELSSAWLLSGLSFRMGLDLGFNDYTKEEPDEGINDLKNLVYWGSFIIDNFAGYVFGRPKMLFYDPNYPIFNNKLNDIKLPHVVNLIAMGDPMIESIYQIMPFKDAEEFKRTFTDKYNQLREYNHRLIQWRNSLPKELFWNVSTLKRDVKIMDHSFKFAFYLIFIILNKPFLLLPIGSDIQMFTVICQEMEIIFRNVEDCCYLKNIVVLYVMILVCKLMLIQILNKNIKKIDDQFERLEFFINYIKTVFKPEVWILTKLPLNMLESRVRAFRQEIQQNSAVVEQTSPITAVPPPLVNDNSISSSRSSSIATNSTNNARYNGIAITGDPTVPYTDENMSQNVGFIKMVDALFSQGPTTGTPTMFQSPGIGTNTPGSALTQENTNNNNGNNNNLHINGNGGGSGIVQGSSETFNSIFSFDLLDIDSYMNQ
ncbi:hypothetical protein JA1_001584 [Spathaspora sp. JA1]|nr:hypothetical protein JA1_001584 [Spathaspora sp. JA1]